MVLFPREGSATVFAPDVGVGLVVWAAHSRTFPSVERSADHMAMQLPEAVAQSIPAAHAPAEDTEVTAAAANEANGASARTSPDLRVVLLAAAMIVGGAFVAWYAIYRNVNPKDFKVGGDYSVFFILLILAQSIERVLQPLTNFLPGGWKVQADLDEAVAKANRTRRYADLKAAAVAQARVDRARSNRGVFLWAAATVIATCLCAALGVFLLRTVVTADADPSRVLDLVITGLAIGAGTKPLHDLIEQSKAAKEKAKDPSETK
jgi:hypothetical protein